MNASVFVPARGCRLPFILSALSLAIAAPALAAELGMSERTLYRRIRKLP